MLDGSAKRILRVTLGTANRSDILREAGFRAPSGHPERCLVCISLILLCRAWSKLDVQVVACNWVGDPFKAWVEGSNPAALTRYSIRFFPFCGTGGRQTYLRHGVILTAAVFQAEGRACPERGRRDIAPHWQCVREAPMRRSLNPSEPWALTHLCIYTAETLWSRWWLFLTISVAPGYVGSGSV